MTNCQLYTLKIDQLKSQGVALCQSIFLKITIQRMCLHIRQLTIDKKIVGVITKLHIDREHGGYLKYNGGE